MDYPEIETGGRRRVIRIVLFLIILSTLPFYCAGFLLWGTAGTVNRGTTTPAFTNTPIGGDLTATRQPTLTPLNLTVTISSPLQPTPLQFIPGFGGGNNNPGGGNNTVPTVFIPPTVFVPPTSTLAPTLTPFPTDPPPPTSTPPPLPTDPPLPTNTPEPLPTDPPLPTDEPPPVEEVAPPVEGGGEEEPAP